MCMDEKDAKKNAQKIQMRYPTVKSRVHRQFDIQYSSCEIQQNNI